MRSWWRRGKRDNGANNAALLDRFTHYEQRILSLFRAHLTVLESYRTTLDELIDGQQRLETNVENLLAAVVRLEAAAADFKAKVDVLKASQADPAALEQLAARVNAAVENLQAIVA